MDCFKGEEGLSLIEVMAALVLLSLLAVTLLSVFTSSSHWVRGGGDKTIAVQYASSIIECVLAEASDLADLNFSDSEVIQISDNNQMDDEFNFSFEQAGKEVLVIDVYAPVSDLAAEATLKISPHQEVSYYPDKNSDGKADINLFFGNNLFAVEVELEWQYKGQTNNYVMHTIVAAR